MKLAVLALALTGANAYVAPLSAAVPATQLAESKADLESLAKDLNPIVGFWDPLNVAGASGSLYGFDNAATIAWYRAAEIKHGRVAMAAFVGYCVQANGIHWATKMTAGGAEWPSGTPPEQWDALPAASKWQIILFVGVLETFGESAGTHYMAGGRPGEYPSFSEAYAKGEGATTPNGADYSPKNTTKRRRAFHPTIMISSIFAWARQEKNGLKDLCMAQVKVAIVLAIAHFGNIWEPTYPRNDNHAPQMFWLVNAFLAIGTFMTWKWKASSAGRSGGTPRVIMLGREQTEEWKGWMQWAFIFYHYYRVYYVYNEIRVFVSAYVWMTGFGNFLYFDKKADFSIERFVSMILRINYFPLLLSYFLTVPLELYYVVPLHTTGFVVAMITCFLGYQLEKRLGLSYWKSRTLAIGISLIAHILFYETPAVDVLLLFSKEIHFRFQADKYSAWMGMAAGLLWGKIGEYMQWAHGFDNDARRTKASIVQFSVGVALIAFWYGMFGSIADKFTYNPVHPYVFVFAVIGWLMIRNCTRYLTECHSSMLEFLGRNTLETYVLQFHLFMTHNVQYIPVVIPGSDASGSAAIKFCNMLLCGSLFLSIAVWARKITVATQLCVVDLVKHIRGTMDTSRTLVIPQSDDSKISDAKGEEVVQLTKLESGDK